MVPNLVSNGIKKTTNNSTLGTNEIEKMNAFRGGRRERDCGRINAAINNYELLKHKSLNQQIGLLNNYFY